MFSESVRLACWVSRLKFGSKQLTQERKIVLAIISRGLAGIIF